MKAEITISIEYDPDVVRYHTTKELCNELIELIWREFYDENVVLEMKVDVEVDDED